MTPTGAQRAREDLDHGVDGLSGEVVDPVEWTRERWSEEGQAAPEHFAAMASLAVIRAGITSAREGRRVEVAEILADEGRQS